VMGSRGTKEGMEADDLLCSRNARPQNALVGRAQWKDHSAPIPEERTSELGGADGPRSDGFVNWFGLDWVCSV
jgi:hypothetical protein